MAGFSFNNALLLLLAIGGLWFAARFILGPRRGAPSLKSMFSRQVAVQQKGLGKDTIRTLLEDTRAFVVGTPDLRGLILAGPFAVEAATPASTVTLAILCTDSAQYSDKTWLPRWAYPARGHPISAHAITVLPQEAVHIITLRGSPPVALHFVQGDLGEAPLSLHAALGTGTILIEDPSGFAEKLRLHWLDTIRNTRSGPE